VEIDAGGDRVAITPLGSRRAEAVIEAEGTHQTR
jgi:hypothetical protein